MGALWALAGIGLSAWKGFSGESQGEDVVEEKEETSLDCWLSTRGGEHSGRGAVSAEGGAMCLTEAINITKSTER